MRQFLKSTMVWVTQHPRADARLSHCCQVTSMFHALVMLIPSVSPFNQLLFKTLAESSFSCDRRHFLHLKSRKIESKSPSWQALRGQAEGLRLFCLWPLVGSSPTRLLESRWTSLPSTRGKFSERAVNEGDSLTVNTLETQSTVLTTCLLNWQDSSRSPRPGVLGPVQTSTGKCRQKYQRECEQARPPGQR